LDLNPDTMKRLLVFSLLMLGCNFSFAQYPLKVVKKESVINTVLTIGRAIDINGKTEDVDESLGKFLKEYGKTRSTSEYFWVVSPLLGGIAYDGTVLYANTEGDDKKTQVWIGIDTAGWRGFDLNKVMNSLEKVAYQFGVKFYRDQVQKEIDQSQRAFDATEKQRTRLANQNKDLNLRVANNDQERIHLEKSLANNKLEKAALLQKLVNNKKSQDSVMNAGLQIKKVIEAQTEKQKKIN
jgi:hypothetical protein